MLVLKSFLSYRLFPLSHNLKSDAVLTKHCVKMVLKLILHTFMLLKHFCPANLLVRKYSAIAAMAMYHIGNSENYSFVSLSFMNT